MILYCKKMINSERFTNLLVKHSDFHNTHDVLSVVWLKSDKMNQKDDGNVHLMVLQDAALLTHNAVLRSHPRVVHPHWVTLLSLNICACLCISAVSMAAESR